MPPPAYQPRPLSTPEKIRIYFATHLPDWTTTVIRFLMDVLKATVSFINQMIKDAIGK